MASRMGAWPHLALDPVRVHDVGIQHVLVLLHVLVVFEAFFKAVFVVVVSAELLTFHVVYNYFSHASCKIPSTYFVTLISCLKYSLVMLVNGLERGIKEHSQ